MSHRRLRALVAYRRRRHMVTRRLQRAVIRPYFGPLVHSELQSDSPIDAMWASPERLRLIALDFTIRLRGFGLGSSGSSASGQRASCATG